MTSAPWDWSYGTDEGPKRPNLPSPEGEALGRELARLFTVPSLEVVRGRFPSAPPPCGDCAFVEGTVPNRSAATVMDALKATIEGVPFHCHHGVEGGEPRHLCRGWAAAMALKHSEGA